VSVGGYVSLRKRGGNRPSPQVEFRLGRRLRCRTQGAPDAGTFFLLLTRALVSEGVWLGFRGRVSIPTAACDMAKRRGGV